MIRLNHAGLPPANYVEIVKKEDSMTRFRALTAFLVLAAAAAVFAQADKPAPAPGFDADACAKHCKEMGAARQKMMDEHKAMIEKHDAAWKSGT